VRYDLSKQLQDLHIDLTVLSQTHFQPHERSLFKIITYIESIDTQKEDGTTVAGKKGIPHNDADLPPLVSIKATEVCIPIGNTEILLAAVSKSPGSNWSNTYITKLLIFRNNRLTVGHKRTSTLSIQSQHLVVHNGFVPVFSEWRPRTALTVPKS
jgi:hypothetical protein